MIDATMYELVGRNAAVVGAMVAAVLLIVQLRTNGVDRYAFADVLSILLIAVPVATRTLRPPRQRSVRDRPAGANADGGRSADDPAQHTRPGRLDTQTAQEIEGVLARGLATVVAAGAWLGAVVLVLLQAWAPAVSALIVFGIAAAGIPVTGHDEAPVAPNTGGGPGAP